VEATRIGAHAFLEKPITLQKLLQAVEQGLSKGASRAVALGKPAVALASVPSEITLSVALPVTDDAALQRSQPFNLDVPLREARDAFEKAYFEFHLVKENGSMTRVADKTGLERTHLYRKLKQLGVDLSKAKKLMA
jgi:DNA-binding NtrC family response regulator